MKKSNALMARAPVVVAFLAILVSGCSLLNGGAGLICGKYDSLSDLDRVRPDGLPIWVYEAFDNCAVGKADWSSAGGKVEGEVLAKSVAEAKMASDIAKKDIRISSETRTETSARGSEVTESSDSKTRTISESEQVTITSKTLKVVVVGYTIYVLAERTSP